MARRAAVVEETDGRARGKSGANLSTRNDGVGGRTGDAEQIRIREVSRTLDKLDLSREEEEAVERLSHHLVERLLRGPVLRALAHAGAWDGAGSARGAVEHQETGTPPNGARGPEASPRTAEATRERQDLRMAGKGARRW